MSQYFRLYDRMEKILVKKRKKLDALGSGLLPSEKAEKLEKEIDDLETISWLLSQLHEFSLTRK